MKGGGEVQLPGDAAPRPLHKLHLLDPGGERHQQPRAVAGETHSRGVVVQGQPPGHGGGTQVQTGAPLPAPPSPDWLQQGQGVVVVVAGGGLVPGRVLCTQHCVIIIPQLL